MPEHSPIIQQLLRGWQQAGWLNWLLLPFSLLYSAVMRVRRIGYRVGIFRSRGPDVPVIVVGNLSVGGTGKSPLVAAIARMLGQAGWRPGIICRGYRGSVGEGPLVVTDEVAVSVVGDEPKMLFDARMAEVAVGRNRAAAAALLHEVHGCDVIISDDGFQHLALKRNIDIVVIDSVRGLGNGWCLPSGPLRESPAALAQASMIVLNGQPDVALAQSLDRTGVPQFTVQMQFRDAYRLLDSSHRQSLDGFRDHPVSAVAGVGNPDRFFAMLTQWGLDVRPHPFPDHHRFTVADFAGVASDLPVMITEKDAVKCRTLFGHDRSSRSLADRIWVVPVDAVPDQEFATLLSDLLEKSA